VGQKQALAMAVKNHLGRRRYTKLAEWLGVAAIYLHKGI
jgi:exodeoxyribonuclease V alpha subunit